MVVRNIMSYKDAKINLVDWLNMCLFLICIGENRLEFLIEKTVIQCWAGLF